LVEKNTIRRKILIIGLFPPLITGQSVATQALFEELKKRHIAVDRIELSIKTNVDTLVEKVMKILENLSVFGIYLWKIPFGKKIIYLSPAASTLGFFRDYPAISLAHFFGQKTVAHFHIGDYKTFVDSRSPFLKKLIIRTLLKVDKIILLAENTRPNFDISPLIHNKITVVQNGIAEAKDALNVKNLGDENEEIVLLFLSNMIQSKGYMDVLKAMDILVNEYKINAKALFCGKFMTSPDDKIQQTAKQAEEQFFQFVAEKKLEKKVSFLGLINGDAKAEVFSKAHIFVLPTEYYIEGLPISIIEALSYGMPIIASAHRGIPDLVKEGETGFLINSEDKASFIAQKVAFLKKNGDLYASMSQTAIAHYKMYYTDKTHFDNIVSILQDLDNDL
jgi:glycosyltransferase involved in cell wall biosynthesis